MPRPVVILPRGGLGNQLFIWAAGYELARRLRTRLAVDVSPLVGDPTRRYELDSFDSGLGEPEVHRSPIFQRRRRTFSEASFRFDPRFGRISRPSTLEGYFQSWRYAECSLPHIVERIKRVSSPTSWFEQQLATIEALDVPPVVLHVRAGDYLNPEVRRLHGYLGPGYYGRAIDAISRSESAKGPVWVFSDDTEEARQRLSELPIDRYVQAPSESSPVESLVLMGMASAHVIGNSSYSWWAATVARFGSAGPVIAPQRWFGDLNHDSTDLLWPNWHTIPNDF